MEILNVTSHDYANFSHDNANALRSVGLNCQDVKTNPHAFKYVQESVIMSQEKIKQKMIEADIIQIFHTDVTMLNILKTIDYLSKRIFVYYCDSRYRSNPTLYNDLFNPIVDKSFICLTEFEGLGAKNEEYIVGAIDVRSTPKFGHEIGNILKVAHYPSNPEVKGTAEIIEMIQKLKALYEFQYSVEKVSHFEQRKRMNNCDIYIELFKPVLKGKQYGSWGITAMEAAASGKIVVTQNLNNKLYLKTYGECPLILCDTEQDFLNNMENLLSLNKLEISTLQTETYNWINNKHSYKATGERLKKLLEL